MNKKSVISTEWCNFCDGSGEGIAPDSRCSYCSSYEKSQRLYEETADREEIE